MSESTTTGGGERPWQPWERNYSGNRIGVRHDGDWTILHVLSGGAETTTSIREHEAWDLAGRVSPKLLATLQEIGAENRRMRDALHELSAVCAAGNAEELREAAEEIYCGDDCQNHSYDASCNAHECSLEGTGECRWHRSESLKSLAEALETHAALAAQPAPVREGVVLPRDLATRAFEIVSEHWDRGDPDAGWQSDELQADIASFAQLLAAPPVPEPVAPEAGEDLAALSAALDRAVKTLTFVRDAGGPNHHRGSATRPQMREAAQDALDEIAAYRSGRLLPAPPQPAAQGEPVAHDWKLVPAVATRDWAYDLAIYRQGRSSTPRCEGPTQGEVEWGMDRIREVLAVAPQAPVAPTQPAATGRPLSSDQIERSIGGAYEMPDGRKFWIDGPVAREMARRVLAIGGEK